ncbi:MAG: hypothetical protein IJE93_08455 [Clostridia bacterium]|nr:hypothetical protein [Clostridia bacterium]
MWAILLLFVSVGGYIYYYLLPSSSVSDTAKAVLCVFSLSAVCAPLFGAFSDINTDIFDFEAYSTMNEEEALSFYAQQALKTVEEKTAEAVQKYTAVPYKLETDVNISEDYSINIEYIRLIFEKEIGDISELLFALEEVFGFIPEITVQNENRQS